MKDNIFYFKYEKQTKFVGYRKIIEQSDVKALQKCSLSGFKHIKTWDGVIQFSIDNQLY